MVFALLTVVVGAVKTSDILNQDVITEGQSLNEKRPTLPNVAPEVEFSQLPLVCGSFSQHDCPEPRCVRDSANNKCKHTLAYSCVGNSCRSPGMQMLTRALLQSGLEKYQKCSETLNVVSFPSSSAVPEGAQANPTLLTAMEDLKEKVFPDQVSTKLNLKTQLTQTELDKFYANFSNAIQSEMMMFNTTRLENILMAEGVSANSMKVYVPTKTLISKTENLFHNFTQPESIEIMDSINGDIGDDGWLAAQMLQTFTVRGLIQFFGFEAFKHSTYPFSELISELQKKYGIFLRKYQNQNDEKIAPHSLTATAADVNEGGVGFCYRDLEQTKYKNPYWIEMKSEFEYETPVKMNGEFEKKFYPWPLYLDIVKVVNFLKMDEDDEDGEKKRFAETIEALDNEYVVEEYKKLALRLLSVSMEILEDNCPN